MRQQLDEIDLVDHDNFRDRVPYEWFEILRREAPVWRHPAPADGSLPSFWVLTKHADIAQASHDPATFSSRHGAALLQLQTFDASLLSIMPDFLLLTDPPEHTALRRIISSAFTPRAIAALGDRMVVLARESIDRIVDSGACDFVDVAAELPIQVIAEMMGVPGADRPKLYDWTTRTFGVEDSDCSASREDFFAAFAELFSYALALCAEKRDHPSDDLLSTLVHAEVDGEQLSDTQLSLFFFLLATAGNETTRTMIMQGMLTLLEHPAALAELRADRSLVPGAVDEVLRYASPVHNMARTATRAVELRGQRIEPGDLVSLWYVSGNRDEDVFESPATFDIHREGPVLHQAFGGGGAHYCLGASLARMEGRVMFDEILTRIRDIEQTGPALRLRSNFTNGLKSLPIRFRPA